MNYKTYEVHVYDDGTKHWYLNNKRHREDGPAVECANGDKYWYLNGVKLSEQEWKEKVNQKDCDGKFVTVDGVKYKLQKV